MTDREILCALVGDDPPDAVLTPTLVALARDERVHLLIADRLKATGWPDGGLAEDLRAATIVDAARQAELRLVLAALDRVGVRPIVIKGAAIACTHYPRPELRPRADTDLLIADGTRDSVHRTLTALGYERPLETDGELITSQFHFAKRDRAGLEHVLDVHWRISNARTFAGALSYEELASTATPLPALGPVARGPAPVHALLLACVHRTAHHIESTDLLWLYDISLLARRCSTGERQAFASLATERRMRAVCGRNLRLAAEAFGGIGQEWIDAVQPVPGEPEPSAAFLQEGLRQVDILRADLMATSGWASRAQLLREHLFPRAAFMYARYRTERPLALPFLYVHRILTGWPKWFRG